MNDYQQNPFPLLIPVDTTLREYKGFIVYHGRQYPVEIGVSSIKESIEDCKFNTTQQFYDLLEPALSTIKQRLLQCKDLKHFFLELKDILDRLPSYSKNNNNNRNNENNQQQQKQKINSLDELPFEVYSLVLNEIDQIGWNKIESIDKSLSTFKIKVFDKKKRNFSIEFIIPIEYPHVPARLKCSIPLMVTTPQQPPFSIVNAISAVTRQIDTLQPFFDVMDDIDSKTWVLEPSNPQRSDCSRRIALGNNCSLLIEINPLSPCTFPSECRLLGAERLTAPLRAKLNSNLTHWQSNRSPLINFEMLFEQSFPLKQQQSSTSEFISECSICYAHRLDGGESTIPDEICNNQRCQKLFHRVCLFEWLRSLPTSNISFDRIFGQCPYCSDPISVTYHQKKY